MEIVKSSRPKRETSQGIPEESDTKSKRSEFIDGVVVGLFLGFDSSDKPKIVFPGCADEGVVARSTKPLTSLDIGKSIALLFEGGDADKPIIIGFMYPVAEERVAVEELKIPPDDEVDVTIDQETNVEIDGKHIELKAEHQIVLRCGASSITLTKAGKILVRGKYVLSRSSGVNRIKGGSVQIN